MYSKLFFSFINGYICLIFNLEDNYQLFIKNIYIKPFI